MRVIKLHNGQTFGITDEMQGKMQKMWSLNTSPEENPFCQGMRLIEGFICQSCYSKRTEKRWQACHDAWKNNGIVLSQNDLEEDELPIIKQPIFRFQAHGDLINVTHYLNLVKIARANPKTIFVMWTKNLPVVYAGGCVQESNLIYVYSTPKLNDLEPFLPKGFHRVFTVYTRPFIREHKEIIINCATRSCWRCRKCYSFDSPMRINELIKSNGHKD